MKKPLIYAATATFALSAMLLSCKEKDKDVAVTGVTLNRTSATRIAGETFKLQATVSPDDATNKNVGWASSDQSVATVSGGTVSALISGTTTITATTEEGNKTATCDLTVVSGCNTNTPGFGESLGTVSFKTAQTWKVGNQEWSDAVMAANCQKATYEGYDGNAQNFNADCRSNEGYGDLFSWCAVIRFQDELCSDDWHVPTMEDFIALDKALGGTGENRGVNADDAVLLKYFSSWGGAYGGYCDSDGSLGTQGSLAYYWSQSERSSPYGYSLYLYSSGLIYPQYYDGKNFGFTLRCVR